MAWTDETRAQAIELYKDANPTAETSAEILQEIAAELGESPNGVRMILTKAGVYVSKTPAKKTASAASGSGEKGARVSKEAAHARLTAAIEAAGQNVDSEVVGKLTGKAAIYLAEVIEAIAGGDEDE